MPPLGAVALPAGTGSETSLKPNAPSLGWPPLGVAVLGALALAAVASLR